VVLDLCAEHSLSDKKQLHEEVGRKKTKTNNRKNKNVNGLSLMLKKYTKKAKKIKQNIVLYII